MVRYLLYERTEKDEDTRSDTSNHPMSVALVEDDQLKATITLNMVRNHSVYVLPAINDLFTKVGWQPSDIERIVVAKGPGSYTGCESR